MGESGFDPDAGFRLIFLMWLSPLYICLPSVFPVLPSPVRSQSLQLSPHAILPVHVVPFAFVLLQQQQQQQQQQQRRRQQQHR